MLQGSLSKMDGMDAAKGFYGMSPKSNAFLGLIVHGYYFLVGAGAIPARLFMRSNLGERAFSPFAFLLCVIFFIYYGFVPFDEEFILLGIIGFGANAVGLQMIGDISLIRGLAVSAILNPTLWFIIWLIWKGVKHFKAVIKRVKANQIQYSYYRGAGKYFEHRLGGKKWGFDIDERFIRMVIEPLAVLRGGFLLFIIGLTTGVGIYYWGKGNDGNIGYLLIFLGWMTNLGLLVMFSAFCLFLEEYGIMARIRDAALDLIDGEYDMAFVMKKKEELQGGRTGTDENVKLAEEVYQSNLDLATMATMPSATPSDTGHLHAAPPIRVKSENVVKEQPTTRKQERKKGSALLFWGGGILLLSTLGYLLLSDKFSILGTENKHIGKNIQAFSPEELCELLNSDDNEKSLFLSHRGYKEDALSNYPDLISIISGFKCSIFPFPSGGGKILTLNEEGLDFYAIIFDTTQKEAYLEFIKKFPAINNPAIDKTSDVKRVSPIFAGCNIVAEGLSTQFNGYSIVIRKSD